MRNALVFLFLLTLAAALSACIVAGPPTAQVSPAYPTVLITQVVTQVVVPAPTYTQPPDPTKSPYPTLTPEWDPFSAPITFPKVGCSASRLSVGRMAFVALTGTLARLYSDQDFTDNPGIRPLEYGEKMQVLDGPWCWEATVVWKVYMLRDKRFGFVGEGDGNTYWILPLSPAEPTVDVPRQP